MHVEVVAATPDNDDAPAAEEPTVLLPRGPVEVRILCERPELVGELAGKATPAAVEFVAFLATHGYRSGQPRLRDAIGTGRDASRAEKTVYNAASEARGALGTELLPVASGNEVYLLSGQVTCDWARFQQLKELAQRDGGTEGDALGEALALVEGIPALLTRRFGWLEEEGLLRDITSSVLDAARRLAEIAGEDGALLRLAIAKWRMMLPSDPELLALERRVGVPRSPAG